MHAVVQKKFLDETARGRTWEPKGQGVSRYSAAHLGADEREKGGVELEGQRVHAPQPHPSCRSWKPGGSLNPRGSTVVALGGGVARTLQVASGVNSSHAHTCEHRGSQGAGGWEDMSPEPLSSLPT